VDGRPSYHVVYVGRIVRQAAVIVAALCVAFYMANIASAQPVHADSVMRGLLCIHTYEAPWNYDKDAYGHNKTYDGGLQMDLSFQKTYGFTYVRVFGRKVRVSFYDLWGTADHWPIKAQLQAGRNAYRSRGWWPWPNTARFCQLL
jgi:hypothetical protein